MAFLPSPLKGLGLVGSLLTLVICSYFLLRRRKSIPYPPGPRGLPLIGNLLDIPEAWAWVTYAKWSEVYASPLVHLEVLGNHIIIINDADTARELFEKRSFLYSDRPRMALLKEVSGFDWSWAFTHYGDFWKTCRRLFNQFFRENEARKFRPQQMEATHDFLRRLLNDPDNYFEHIKLLMISLMLDIGYGIKVESPHNKFYEIIECANDSINCSTQVKIVDPLPWTQYLPGWLPGMGWKALTKGWRDAAYAAFDKPYAYTKDSVKNGTARPSVLQALMERPEIASSAENERILKSIGGIITIAGSDTSAALLTSLFVALHAFPHVQRKAQEELDLVIGHDRLPTFADKAELPYVAAVCLEITRWSTIIPLGLPHANLEDDIYVTPNGNKYFIPKGSTVLGNVWAMCNDENIYPDPARFSPERFLTKDLKKLDANLRDPGDVAFGFRQRHCPGRTTAEDAQFITVASILACFNIESIDKTSKEFVFEEYFDPSFAIYPKNFKCKIVPRTRETAELIKHTE